MEEIWLAVAFVIFLVIAWRYGARLILGLLDQRAAQVRSELDEAAKLCEEAQALLAQHQKQLHDGEARAAAILKHAEEEAERQARHQQEALEAGLKRREQAALRRIEQEEARTVQELRARAAETAMAATRRLARKRLDGDGASGRLDDAVEEVVGRLKPAS